MRILVCAACVGALLVGLTLGRPPNEPARSGLRRPVALALADAGRWLFVGNRNGCVAVIDTAAGRVVADIPVGRTVADLVAMPDGMHLLAVDEEAGELVVLRRDGAGLKVSRRLAVGPGPVGVAVAGSRASVVALWPRRLIVIDLSASAEPRVGASVSLPFAPRLQVPIGDDRVVVLALAGVGEVAVGGRRDGGWDRLGVGRGPTAVAVGPDGRHAFVANTFSDSVSVLDLTARRVAAEVPLGEKTEA
ncbi:MAG TPA: YncE family protein, partial [Gemmataceae bacterium]|nr:YncE family protein [Gemmataceae bacterium]